MRWLPTYSGPWSIRTRWHHRTWRHDVSFRKLVKLWLDQQHKSDMKAWWPYLTWTGSVCSSMISASSFGNMTLPCMTRSKGDVISYENTAVRKSNSIVGHRITHRERSVSTLQVTWIRVDKSRRSVGRLIATKSRGPKKNHIFGTTIIPLSAMASRNGFGDWNQSRQDPWGSTPNLGSSREGSCERDQQLSWLETHWRRQRSTLWGMYDCKGSTIESESDCQESVNYP